MELQPIIKAKKNLSDKVKDSLITYIKQMDVQKNPKLPSEQQLSSYLGVSRVTLRRALDDLEQSGIVIRIHGKGTFVNPEATQIKLNMAESGELMQKIKLCGYDARVELVRKAEYPASKQLAEILQIEPGDTIMEIEKVFFADQNPAIICIDRFPKNILNRPLDDAEYATTIFELLRKTAGKIIVRDKVEIMSMSKQQMEKYSHSADRMNCDSILALNCINYDQDNVPVIYDSEFYNTDFIRFTLIRPKKLIYC